jgi:hypothetical protein
MSTLPGIEVPLKKIYIESLYIPRWKFHVLVARAADDGHTLILLGNPGDDVRNSSALIASWADKVGCEVDLARCQGFIAGALYAPIDPASAQAAADAKTAKARRKMSAFFRLFSPLRRKRVNQSAS